MEPVLHAMPLERTAWYTHGQAARAIGKRESTLSRDVNRGKISRTRNDDGYPPIKRSNGSESGASNNDRKRGSATAATGMAWREVELLHERLAENGTRIAELIVDHAELVHEKDAPIADKNGLIEDPSRGLDAATRLLTDQPPRLFMPAPPRIPCRQFLAWRRWPI